MSKEKNVSWTFVVLSLSCSLLFILGSFSILTHLDDAHGQEQMSAVASIQRSLQARPVPQFMYRPYYGGQSILQRTTSYVDHDKPWYMDDGTFVRFDGRRWTGGGASVASCNPGVSCYDGHNGYDLNMRFEPVLSTGAGTVIRAGWYNPEDHNSSLGLWSAVDHGNGLVTAYGHMSALTVWNGEHVGAQWQIGTSGTTGASMGPHLHMATYYLPYWLTTDPFGWRGNYPDPMSVPDHYLWMNNPGANVNFPNLSSTGRAAYPGAVVVDDGGPGWSSTGAWVRSAGGFNNNLHWTNTASAGTSATCSWQPLIPADGNYTLGAYVDVVHAGSSWVPYTVYSASASNPALQLRHTTYVDESHIGRFLGPFGIVATGSVWVNIGTYYLRRGMNTRVIMSNATGEAGQQMAADAVEFVRV